MMMFLLPAATTLRFKRTPEGRTVDKMGIAWDLTSYFLYANIP